MELRSAILVAAVLLTTAVGRGYVGPEEDPPDTVEETETTPGETVGGGEPTDEPAHDAGAAAGEGETEAAEETTEGEEATEDERDG